MTSPFESADKIGSDRTIQNPNDPKLTGTYKDEVGLPTEANHQVANLPKAPDPSPYKIIGGT